MDFMSAIMLQVYKTKSKLPNFFLDFLSSVIYHKKTNVGRVHPQVGLAPFCFGSGYALVETWHAMPVPRSLRSLRAFRCYPSRSKEGKKSMFYLFDKALFFNDLRIDARAGAKPQ